MALPPSLATPPQSDLDLPPEPPPRPLLRRAALRALRVLRPAVVPLLHRLDVRIRWAVDRTATAATVHSTATAVHALAEAGQKQQDDGKFERFRAEILSTIGELRTELLTRLDLLAMSGLRERQFRAEISALETRLQETLRAELLPLLSVLVERADLSILQSAGNAEGLRASISRQFAVPLGRELAIRTAEGYLLAPTEDARLVLAIMETAGRLEPGTLTVMRSLIGPGSQIIDIGAHVGTHCLPLAREVGAKGHVLALEPTPRSASLLKRMLALNGVEERVTVLECAVGSAAGTAQLSISPVLGENSLFPLQDAIEVVDVDVRRLDDCVPLGTPVDLIKLDVEGAELQAWRGMQRIIAESPRLAVIVEFGPSHLRRVGTEIADWLGELCKPGFQAWGIEEETGLLRPAQQDWLQDVFSVNLLLLRDHPSTRPGLHLA